jgi:hypothetical protein
LVSELSKRGLDIEVVRGAELDSEKAMSAVLRFGKEALYVFCRDGDLDEYGVKHLQGVMLHSGQLDARHTVTVSPRDRSVAADASALVTKAKLLGRGRSESTPKRNPPQPPGPTRSLGPTVASGFDDEEPTTEVFTPPHSGNQAVAPPNSESPTGVFKPPHSDKHPIVPPNSESTAPEDVEVEFDGLSALESRKRKGIAAGLGGLALAALAALFFASSSGDGEDDSLASADAGPTPEELIAQTQAKLAAEAQAAADAKAASEAEAEATKVAADEAYRAERAAAAGAGPQIEAAAEGEEVPADALVEEEPDEVEEPAAPAEEEALDAALDGRKLRALDMLVIDPRRSRRGNFKKAIDHCTDRDAYGVTQWRLPTVGEVTTLVSTGIVSRDRYWTSTEANTSGSRRLLYDGKRKRIRSYSPYYKGARGVCVRKRSAGEE